MLYLLLNDGSHREIPEAKAAAVEAGQLVCRNERGFIVAKFDASIVSAYGHNQALAQDYSAQAQQSGVR